MKAIDALRELANVCDEHNRPSMTFDHMRHEVIRSMTRNETANDNREGT